MVQNILHGHDRFANQAPAKKEGIDVDNPCDQGTKVLRTLKMWSEFIFVLMV
jgi:hypothetical protein